MSTKAENQQKYCVSKNGVVVKLKQVKKEGDERAECERSGETRGWGEREGGERIEWGMHMHASST